MSKFFINRPIVAMVIAILMVIVGQSLSRSSGGLFPNIVHARGSSAGHLRRRGCADDLNRPWRRPSSNR